MPVTYISCAYGTYYFDAVFKETHSLTNVITSNPVQTGANVNDHVYSQPITLSLDIGISDCMTSIQGNGFPSGTSRSVSAYQTLLNFWQTHVSMSITTAFNKYDSMLIQNISANRDETSMNALRATITFQQLILVKVGSEQISTVPQVTDSTAKSNVNSVTQITQSSDQSAEQKRDANLGPFAGLADWWDSILKANGFSIR